ncbi:GGDEF domain-containing protein [Allomesorhizobium camelthorni]|uniref:GGDEF domain-containing protein n=1 Tax=Allomesorhizobium camelthorni TaxID=475069 RepID=UPI0031B5E7EE
MTPARIQLAWVTVLGTVACVIASLILNYLLFFDKTLIPFGQMVISASVVAVVIGAPLSFLLALRQQEIKRIRCELTRSATYDTTTAFYKWTVFSSVVDRRAVSESTEGPRRGAFLAINASNLRAINMRYGLRWGEEALRLVASVIRSSVRTEDVVGRLGASEFGIFLPGATEKNAREVGERIRAGVAANYFTPAGAKGILSVSVGGVFFEDELGFEGMFRAAEYQLWNAEISGSMMISQASNDFLTRRDDPTAH